MVDAMYGVTPFRPTTGTSIVQGWNCFCMLVNRGLPYFHKLESKSLTDSDHCWWEKNEDGQNIPGLRTATWELGFSTNLKMNLSKSPKFSTFESLKSELLRNNYFDLPITKSHIFTTYKIFPKNFVSCWWLCASKWYKNMCRYFAHIRVLKL